MRKIIKAMVLSLMLALPVCAGDIGQPRLPSQNNQQLPATTESQKAGNIGCPIAASEITMTLLQTLLVLF